MFWIVERLAIKSWPLDLMSMMDRCTSFLLHLQDSTAASRGEPVYPLRNILFMSICEVISGADLYVAIAVDAESHRDSLEKFVDLSEGVPSHLRFNAILHAIDPDEFESMLRPWITELHKINDGQVTAIEGKTLRRSYDSSIGKAAIHRVSAWATANHIRLGRMVVDQKSSEITAIPKRLEIIEIPGALVTIDAMGCQTEIAEKILTEDGDDCLAVKGNQPTLHEGIRECFANQLEDNFARTEVAECHSKEIGHGRVDDRSFCMRAVPDDLPAIGVAINNSDRARGDR